MESMRREAAMQLASAERMVIASRLASVYMAWDILVKRGKNTQGWKRAPKWAKQRVKEAWRMFNNEISARDFALYKNEPPEIFEELKRWTGDLVDNWEYIGISWGDIK